MQYDGCSSCLFQMVLYHASCGAGTLPPWTLVRREVAFLLGMEDGRIGTENRQMGELHKRGGQFDPVPIRLHLFVWLVSSPTVNICHLR